MEYKFHEKLTVESKKIKHCIFVFERWIKIPNP